MKKYLVVLPKSLNLPVDENRDLHRAYSDPKFEKVGITEAESPEKAFVNYMFRNFREKSPFKIIMAKLRSNRRSDETLLADEFGAEVYKVPAFPTWDMDRKRIPEKHGKTFQKMELALEMSKNRGTRVEDCYSEVAGVRVG
jgi:hypothetical protein